MFKHFEKHFEDHFAEMQKTNLHNLFTQEPNRYTEYQQSAAGLTLDFCRQPVTLVTLELLDSFANEVNLKKKINAMFAGEKINQSENRSVLHTALRGSDDPVLNVKIATEHQKMNVIVTRLHQKTWLGATKKVITDIINLGIGGSDLGPRMVASALKPYHHTDVKVHFVANVDGSDLYETLKNLNPETTLFIIASKSFSTQETLLNAETAKAWLRKALPEAQLQQHFIGITSQPEKAIAWGIHPDHLLEMWDFIGGRYSLWSSIGLPIALQVGMTHFNALLQGAHELDQHFLEATPQQNLPILLAFLSVMNQNFYGAQSHAVLAYNQYLELFPTYMQQVDMESNGKSVTMDNKPIDYQTGVVLWGGIGTNGQHSFHQLLHQGTLRIPVDFILALTAHHPYQEQQQALMANCLAQAEALSRGNSKQSPPLEKLVPGNRPSNIIFMEALTPQTLGALIALYEHKIFVQSLFWDINAFDQWGVELGKQLATPLLSKIQKINTISVKTLSKILP